MAKRSSPRRGAGVSCSSEGRKGSTPRRVLLCLSGVLAASLGKARAVSLLFVISFPMAVSVTYLTLFELIKLGNQGEHISGGVYCQKIFQLKGRKRKSPFMPSIPELFHDIQRSAAWK